MEYISYSFIAFVAAGLILYALLPKAYGKYILLLASLIFVGLSGGIFSLAFLCISIAVTFVCARAMERTEKNGLRRLMLFLTVLFHLSLLFYFKYQNFWEYTKELFYYISGSEYLPELTELRAPLGISFYTLMLISYAADVYMKKRKAEASAASFTLYVSYFGHIVQGPIDAYGDVEKDMKKPGGLCYDDLVNGALLAAYGLLKKLVVSERLGILVDAAFSDIGAWPWYLLLLSAAAFSLQLYTDFSGCMDIVTGVSRMFGIRLSENFRQPFFSQSVAEFWRRWHITLGAFFRKYVYIPLGGNRKGQLRKHLNTIAVFSLSGLWHGGNWTFVIGTGLLHCVYMILGEHMRPLNERLLGSLHIDGSMPLIRILRSLWVFILVTLGFVLFRSESIAQAAEYLYAIASFQTSAYGPIGLSVIGLSLADVILVLMGLILIFAVSYFRETGKKPGPLAMREDLALLMLMLVIVFGCYGRGYDASAFIYAAF